MKRMRSGTRLPGFHSLLAAAALAVATVAPVAGADWAPTEAVEIVVAASPGGGNDNIARVMQKIMQNERLVEAPLNVVNKPGAGGAIAFGYVGERKGNGHYVAVASNTLLTSHIAGISKLHYADLTPLAVMINEYIGFVVKPDSPLRDGRDLVARLKSDPAGVTFGMASALGNINHIAIGTVARAAGIDPKKLKIVVFRGSGQVMTAALGGHVDVAVGPPSVAARHVEAGKLRVLAITSPKRLGGVLAEAPTWKELGLDALVVNWRGVLGPGGLNGSQTAFWDRVFSRLARTEAWNERLRKSLWENAYLGSRETQQYLKTQYDDLKQALTDLGFAR
ncbi:MAG: tripartite tricarboxylate transporter substrate binding protein [Betaproteobacteria bacterium]|nr:tripartite tricarboxylate transporter substrate binding protein [Betaproteobacteria bacterium]